MQRTTAEIDQCPFSLARAMAGAAFVCLVALAGCGDSAPGPAGASADPQEVVVYSALDEGFAKVIFAAFERDTGIHVLANFDTESTKTVGLAEKIIAERDRPRCDLFWNNEVLHTIRLEKLGLLRSYDSTHAQEYPESARSPEGMWYGFAARARVLAVNTNMVSEARRPDSIRALADPQWVDHSGMAKPLFGTTATHAACLFAAWGPDKAQEFFTQVKRSSRIMSGNKQVAEAVGAGALAFGLTDTDDAMIEIRAGRPVAIVYPDQEEDELGTLFIPNTLALIKDSPNPEAAEKLLDYLLQSEIEDRLVMGPSAQIPLNKNSKQEPQVKTPSEVKAMQVDFAEAADAWDKAAQFLRDEFAAGG